MAPPTLMTCDGDEGRSACIPYDKKQLLSARHTCELVGGGEDAEVSLDFLLRANAVQQADDGFL